LNRGAPLRRLRGGRRRPATEAEARAVRERVRALAGLVGAAALAHGVPGISRRTAAALKRDELVAMERERQSACTRVQVTAPGVVRGFDAMHVSGGFVLAAADGAVPYRTSLTVVPSYDAAQVAAALAADFERHGAPLVLRLDRARCHDAPAVMSVLRAHRVLLLHGPPHHPGYYGQLERQNREHRACLRATFRVSLEALEAMRIALNELWPRPTLGWLTADERWRARPPLTDDRDELHAWVVERAARLRNHQVSDDLAMRLAIEQALIERGHLQLITGARLLRE
jgi:hypothetical protein